MSNYTIVPPAFLGALALLACASSQGEEEEKRIDLKRKQLDETVWATEVLAETYNASIVELWEKLRESENPLEVLRSFPLGKVEEPNWELNRRLPEKVFEFIHKAPTV